MKLLLIGASGFIGTHLRTFLVNQGYEVYATSRREIDGFIHIPLIDLEHELKVLENLSLDTVINLSWDASSVDYWNSTSNVLSLKWNIRLFDLLRKTSVRNVISVGSGHEGHLEVVRNNGDLSSVNRITKYTVSKQLARLRFFETLSSSGKNLTWVRIFQAFGPGQQSHKLLPSIFSHIHQGHTFNLKSPSQARDWIHVYDICRALDFVIKSDVYQADLDIGSGIATTNLDICKFVSKHSNFEFVTAEENDETEVFFADMNTIPFKTFIPTISLFDYLMSEIR